MTEENALQQALRISSECDEIVLVVKTNCDDCDVILEEEYKGEFSSTTITRFLHSEVI